LPTMEQRLHKGPFGLERHRLVDVLRGIALRREIVPVDIVAIEGSAYRFRLYHGAHRYHASVAAGFSHIPAVPILDTR
jgi:hypothetical protein